MANPNLLNQSNLTAKVTIGTLSNASLVSQNLVVAASSTLVTIRNLTMSTANSNLYFTTSNANVNIAIFDSSAGTTKFVQFDYNIPVKSTGYFASVTAPIYLEEGDALQANATFNLTVDYTCSYEVRS